MKKAIQILCVAALIVGLGSIAVAKVTIETVPVGNANNAADTRYDASGYGTVAYEYNSSTYEVTAGQYTEFLNNVAAVDTYGLYNTEMWSYSTGCKIARTGSSGNYAYSVAGDWANRPVNYVSWGDAARFANWLHNGQPTGMQDNDSTEDGAYNLSNTHAYYGAEGIILDKAGLDGALLAVSRESDWKWAIPSEDEWYKAAYHKNDGVTGNYFDFPTSSDSVPSKDLIDPDPGNNVTFYYNSHAIGSPYYRTEVGAHENSDSPYGTFDQGGNVNEWNEGIVEGLFYSLRGGSFNTRGDTYLRAGARDSGTPANEASSIGFRVSQVPEPATLSLLALGGLAMLRRRRRLAQAG